MVVKVSGLSEKHKKHEEESKEETCEGEGSPLSETDAGDAESSKKVIATPANSPRRDQGGANSRRPHGGADPQQKRKAPPLGIKFD